MKPLAPFGTLVSVQGGFAFKSTDFQTGSATGVPVVRMSNLSGGRLELSDAATVPSELVRGLDRFALKPGDFLFGMTGSLSNWAIVKAENLPAYLNQRVGRLIRKSGNIFYAGQVFCSDYFQRQIRLLSSGAAQANISPSQIEEIDVFAPPFSEQQKIADILGAWDEALEKLDALIAAKDRRKRGLMQQLLAVAAQKTGHGHARHRLGTLVERVTRRNTIASDNVLTISAQKGLINQREYFNRSVAGADLSGYCLLERGEFAYNRSASIGFPYGAIKRLDRYDTGIVSTLYLCFRIKAETEVFSNYLAHYLDGGFLNAGLRAIAKEGARAHGLLNVSADEFFDLDIFIPPLALQKTIATILDTAAAELRLLRQQRAALDQQKRGLMQQLLTGKIRVTTP